MSLSYEISPFTQMLICGLALLSLISLRPPLSALFLFLETILISIIIATEESNSSNFLVASLFLSIITLITIGNNIYFETTYRMPNSKLSKINLFIGCIAFYFFWTKIDNLSLMPSLVLSSWLHIKNGFMIITAGFAIFVILFAALSIFEIKISKPRDRYEP